MKVSMRVGAALMLLGLVQASGALAGEKEIQKARDAVVVLDEIMRAPDQSVPASLLRDAYAVAVIPNVVKAGFVVGGRGGKGLISVKTANGTWSNPSYLKLAGASVGFQAGVQATDVVLVFRSKKGVDTIVNGKVTLGGDMSVAAGPVGRTAQASTDGHFKAEIYSYSRARGLFAGVALDGAIISIDHRANQSIYGRNTTPRAIFEGRVNMPPGEIVDLRDRLEEYSAR
ncbi:MAG: lipid-binding SYLF domain-containing protein [Xanthomonadales bacterium]|nr:lipid-binding SYLF domain-containing protein [Xanthomonadales bacterium]